MDEQDNTQTLIQDQNFKKALKEIESLIAGFETSLPYIEYSRRENVAVFCKSIQGFIIRMLVTINVYGPMTPKRVPYLNYVQDRLSALESKV
jgi:hypothetical protein